jgi:hypothetical protein
MAEYWVDPQNGNDGAAGTLEAPWKYPPGLQIFGSTVGNSVVAGDIINVKNGSRVRGRLLLTHNNLTYRGYGLATPLYIDIPIFIGRKPILHKTKIVREEGVHEGYWTIDGGDETAQGALNYSTRSDCVIEDVAVVNCVIHGTAVAIGIATQAAEGAVLRRFIIDTATAGIQHTRPNTLIEYGRVENIRNDGITLSSLAAQSYHAGKYNTIQYVNFINNSYDTDAAIGDPFQLNTGDGYQGNLTIRYCYINKASTVKQGIMLSAIKGTIRVENNYLDGQHQGHIQIGMNKLLTGSKVYVRNNYWTVEKVALVNTLPFVRFTGDYTETGSLLVVENNYAEARAMAGLFALTNANVAGEVIIRNNLVEGSATQISSSWQGCISLHTTGTIDAGASFLVENNVLIGESIVGIKLPTGSLNDSRWVVRNNIVEGALNFAAVGAYVQEVYTKDTFEAAHSYATGNKEEAVTEAATKGAGIHSSYHTDINGKQFYNPPSIGAYEYERPRISRT